MFLAVCAFALSVLLTPLIREIAIRRGCLDRPDSNRKRHQAPIPRLGGVAIVLACAGSFGIFSLIDLHGSPTMLPTSALVWKLLPAAMLVFIIGLLDDLAGLTPWQKLLGEVFAAGLACAGGIQIQSLAGSPISAFLGVPLTILWLVGCTNAFNLIDGLDGLASGLGLLATLTILAAGFLHNDFGLVMATAPLAGALLGFLLFNFNPASIFLGDCGSLWLGFMLACYGVIWSQKTTGPVLSMVAPLMALSIPLLDMVLSILRRFLQHQPVLRADHDHIHHRLLKRGFTPRRSVVLLYAAGALAASLSLLQTAGRGGDGLLIVVFCATIWVGIQYPLKNE